MGSKGKREKKESDKIPNVTRSTDKEDGRRQKQKKLTSKEMKVKKQTSNFWKDDIAFGFL